MLIFHFFHEHYHFFGDLPAFRSGPAQNFAPHTPARTGGAGIAIAISGLKNTKIFRNILLNKLVF